MDFAEHFLIVFLIAGFFFHLGCMVGSNKERTKWAQNLAKAVRNTRPR